MQELRPAQMGKPTRAPMGCGHQEGLPSSRRHRASTNIYPTRDSSACFPAIVPPNPGCLRSELSLPLHWSVPSGHTPRPRGREALRGRGPPEGSAGRGPGGLFQHRLILIPAPGSLVPLWATAAPEDLGTAPSMRCQTPPVLTAWGSAGVAGGGCTLRQVGPALILTLSLHVPSFCRWEWMMGWTKREPQAQG